MFKRIKVVRKAGGKNSMEPCKSNCSFSASVSKIPMSVIVFLPPGGQLSFLTDFCVSVELCRLYLPCASTTRVSTANSCFLWAAQGCPFPFCITTFLYFKILAHNNHCSYYGFLSSFFPSLLPLISFMVVKFMFSAVSYPLSKSQLHLFNSHLIQSEVLKLQPSVQ